ncbi:MAG TPA: SMP-30/gluconolactonase/LRE family protein [Gaiellaceae bacterium]
MSSIDAVLAFDARLELGESPVWDERTGTLYAVDILGGAIVCCDPGSGATEAVARLDEPVGSIALRRDGGLVAAGGTAVVLLDEQARATVLAEIPDAEGLRLNDGVCDARGRLWVGTMALDGSAGRGTLYRYDERGLASMVAPVSISNGIDWSTDGTHMYYVDSPSRRVDVFAFDARDGSLADRRTLVEIDDADGSIPDGLTVDAEDHIWVAFWDGWAIRRYRPDGSLDRIVALPVARPTSCAFGGDDLNDLYVTSARTGLTADALEAQPHAGGVFVLRPGVRGRAPNRFAG